MQSDSSREIVKGINIILVTNIINLILNSVTSFILPKFLAVDAYAQIKEYQMYVGYVGLLHLGYTEGMYLRYGGRAYLEIGKAELKKQMMSLLGLEVILVSTLMLICRIYNQHVLMLAIVSALPINMAGAYKLVYQATGEFKRYGIVMNMTSIITLIINIICLFFMQTQNAYVFIGAYIICYYVIWFILERKNTFGKGIVRNISRKLIVDNIKSGFLLMLGNFSSIIQTTMDRLFVKTLLTSADFAYYSFAVSMESMINVLITPLTVTMYSYFCREREQQNYKKLLHVLLVASTILLSGAYLLNFIVLKLIPQYMLAVDIIYLLFATQFIYVFVKGIYLNLYKANNMQKKYFTKLIIVLLIGFSLNCFCYSIMSVKESFAIATFITALVWFLLCAIDFPNIGMGKCEYVYIVYEIIIFFFIAYYAKNAFIIGIVQFIACSIIGTYLILRIRLDDVKELMKLIIK